MPQATWKPQEGSEIPGRLNAAETNALPESAFAFPARAKSR